jgi:hypothetical protein
MQMIEQGFALWASYWPLSEQLAAMVRLYLGETDWYT